MDSNQLIITLPSGDSKTIGNASHYTVPLSGGVDLDHKGIYECALIDVSFPNSGVTNNSYYIFMDILEYSYVGSRKLQILYKTEPSQISAVDKPMIYMKEEGSLIQWRPLAIRNFNSITVTIQESNGTPIPISSVLFSTVTICIRRIA